MVNNECLPIIPRRNTKSLINPDNSFELSYARKQIEANSRKDSEFNQDEFKIQRLADSWMTIREETKQHFVPGIFDIYSTFLALSSFVPFRLLFPLFVFFSRFLVRPTNFLNLCAIFYELINIDDWKAPLPGDQFSLVLIIARSKSGHLWEAKLTRFWLKRSSRIEHVDVKRSIAGLWREMIFIDIYSVKRWAFQFH